jgi:hypothetical protein
MQNQKRRWFTGAALLASGLLAGGVLAGALSANAADPTPSQSGGTSGYGAPADGGTGPGNGTVDETKSQRPDEKLLTGDTAAKARAAALAKYPGATIQRVETDSDGVYEAHLVTKAGERVTVEMDKNFAITGEEARPKR